MASLGLTPADVFGASRVKDYEDRLHLVWENLFRAHTSMYIIKQLAAFPEAMWPNQSQAWFFQLAFWNFSDSVVLSVSKFLKKDEQASYHSMKEWILNHCQAHVKTQVDSHFAHEPPMPDISDLLMMRDRRVAHLDVEVLLNSSKAPSLPLEDLQKAVDATQPLFKHLCLEQARALLPLESRPGVADIMYILNLVARHSAWLRVPEEQPDYWPYFAERLTDEQRNMFNYWRERAGLEQKDFTSIPYRPFQPVQAEGKPASEIIIEERR
jgi:hypothetical protein